MKAFLMIGQSNMSGRGHIGDLPEIVNEHVFVLRGKQYVRAVEPVTMDKPDLAGEGCGLAFGSSVNMLTGDDVLLIPCSFGGTALKDWMPGEKLYENAVNSVSDALDLGATLSGVLWHQGEHDSDRIDEAMTYLKRLRFMMNCLEESIHTRAESQGQENQVLYPLPILVAELGDYLDMGKYSICHRDINRQLHEFAALSPVYACVTAHDLPDKGDHLHFSTLSQRRLGLRFALAWCDIMNMNR